MGVTDDDELKAALAVMIADRKTERDRMEEHEGTGSGSCTQVETNHLHLCMTEKLPHDAVPAILQSEGQTTACSTGFIQRHQANRRSEGRKNSRVVSEMDSERDFTGNDFTCGSTSEVCRGSGMETMYGSMCSATLLGQELERLSQQFSPIGQGQGLEQGLGIGLGPGEGESQQMRNERDQNPYSQLQTTKKSIMRSSLTAPLPFSTAIPPVSKRDKMKLKHNGIKDQREIGQAQGECTDSRAGQALPESGSVRGIGTVDRKRVTQPVSPKFSKMSWQRDKEVEKCNRPEEWEGSRQGDGAGRSGRPEGSIRDRCATSGINVWRKSPGTPSLKPTSVMMTRHGQLGISFGTCSTIESGSCSGAGNCQASIIDTVMGVGALDRENRTNDFKKEEGRFARSISSSVASSRHMERQGDKERGRDRDTERSNTKGHQERGSGLVRVRSALHPNGHLKSQSIGTKFLKPSK